MAWHRRMGNFNESSYILLEKIFYLVELFGLPVAILAWLTVFCGAIGMGILISKQNRVQ